MSSVPIHPGSTDPRLRGWRAAVPWTILAVTLGSVLAANVLVGPPGDVGWFELVFVAIVVALGGNGALVATRQPRNPVGWLLLACAVMTSTLITSSAAIAWSLEHTDGTMPGTGVAAWIEAVGFQPAVIIEVILVPVLFPNGHLLTRRWRWVVIATAVVLAARMLPVAFGPGPFPDTGIANPFGVPVMADISAVLVPLGDVLLVFVLLPLAVLSCVLRYRRGSLATRQQLKWFAAAAAWTVLSLALSLVGGGLGIGPMSDLFWLLSIIGLVLVPMSIGIAILRYRLYDIDRLVSRTVSWAIVTGALVGTFALLVVGLQAVLAPLTSESTLAVAVSTLVAAALFTPVRSRVQRAVDRRFNRARYDAERTVEAFAAQVRDQVELATLQEQLAGSVRGALAPRTMEVWVRTTPEPTR